MDECDARGCSEPAAQLFTLRLSDQSGDRRIDVRLCEEHEARRQDGGMEIVADQDPAGGWRRVEAVFHGG